MVILRRIGLTNIAKPRGSFGFGLVHSAHIFLNEVEEIYCGTNVAKLNSAVLQQYYDWSLDMLKLQYFNAQ